MLQGFLNLVEPKGIAAGTFYLEVPNDFTASMLNQRMRVSLLSAMSAIEARLEVARVIGARLRRPSLNCR